MNEFIVFVYPSEMRNAVALIKIRPRYRRRCPKKGPQVGRQPHGDHGLDLKVNFVPISHGCQLGLGRLRRISSDWPLTLAKRIAQKSLGTKIVRHGLLPEPKVLADEHGDVRGNIFGRHDGGGCVYQRTTQSVLIKESIKHRKKKRDFTDEHGDTMPSCRVTMARNYHRQ